MSVVQSDFTLNKLILLYILREKGCIARSELSDFVLYHKYMDYFALDQYLMELEDSGLITSSDENHRITYSITRSGYETLNLFQLRIPHSLRREIPSTMGLDVSLQQDTDGRYTVTCYVRDYDTHLFELVFHASTQEEAAHIRSCWLQRGLLLYRNLIRDLNAEEP